MWLQTTTGKTFSSKLRFNHSCHYLSKTDVTLFPNSKRCYEVVCASAGQLLCDSWTTRMFKYPWFCLINDSSKDKLILLFRGCSVWLPYFLCDLISSSGCGCLHFYCNFTLVTYIILILHLFCSRIYLHLSLLFINSVILDAMLFINKWLKFSVDIIFKIPLFLF